MKTDVVHLRITPELKEQLRAAAEADNRTISGYIETLILRDLSAKQKETKEATP